MRYQVIARMFHELLSRDRNIPSGDLMLLANRFYTYMQTELSKNYEIVRTPAPGVMRVQVAITNVEKPGDMRDQALSAESHNILIGRLSTRDAYFGPTRVSLKRNAPGSE